MTDYQELDTVTAQWQELAAQAEQIGRALPAHYQDAYYELVLYQVKAHGEPVRAAAGGVHQHPLRSPGPSRHQ